jgi:hypothetical protein
VPAGTGQCGADATAKENLLAVNVRALERVIYIARQLSFGPQAFGQSSLGRR